MSLNREEHQAILDEIFNTFRRVESLLLTLGQQAVENMDTWPIIDPDFSDRNVWATPQEIAPRAHVSVSTVYRMCEEPNQQFAMIMGNGRWQIHKARFGRRHT